MPPDPAVSVPTLLPPPAAIAATCVPVEVAAAHHVGGYKVLGVLGSGGMGIVYKAFDQKLGRIVALKMLRVGADAGEAELARFRGEAGALGSLQHANVVQVFDV